jgi:hypothetical protein
VTSSSPALALVNVVYRVCFSRKKERCTIRKWTSVYQSSVSHHVCPYSTKTRRSVQKQKHSHSITPGAPPLAAAHADARVRCGTPPPGSRFSARDGSRWPHSSEAPCTASSFGAAQSYSHIIRKSSRIRRTRAWRARGLRQRGQMAASYAASARHPPAYASRTRKRGKLFTSLLYCSLTSGPPCRIWSWDTSVRFAICDVS